MLNRILHNYSLRVDPKLFPIENSNKILFGCAVGEYLSNMQQNSGAIPGSVFRSNPLAVLR